MFKDSAKWSPAAACAMVLLILAPPAGANLIVVANWDFQTPVVPTLQYNPSGPGAGWTFNNLSGVAANGSFNVANAPDGQTAFIQNASGQSSSISQSLSGFISSNSYLVRFVVEGRQQAGLQYDTNPLRVELGAQVLTFTYNNTQLVSPIAGTTFYSYESVPITGLDGSATLAFFGTGNPSGDLTTFVDNVQVFSPGDVVTGPFGPDAPSGAVPEPGTWAAAALLAGGAVFARWRRRARLD